jgi:phenylacetate-CoA ligase
MDPGVAMEIITDNDRYPTLSDEGRQMITFLREHPNSPIYRNQSGNRLTDQDLERVRAFEDAVRNAPIEWPPDALPPWVNAFVEKCMNDVPFYRRYGSIPKRFEDLPTISRAELGRDIAVFVPDSIPIDRLINFRTSGTTGHPLLIASHPEVAAKYLVFHKRALRRFGIKLLNGRGKVGVVLIGYQRKCFTYVSVTPAMDESGLAKINLYPTDWRNLDDRAKYLDALNPEVYTGDPISFEILADLPLKTRPRAIISTSMNLTEGLSRRLKEHFGCLVLDIYSMNEAGPIAVADPSLGGHVLLQSHMYVEILDENGRKVPMDRRGEVTLTGGFNFCLPLLRYRTGDYAALRHSAQGPVLMGLEGRPPVRFRTMHGEWINNIEVTHILRKFPIPRFALHQKRDGSLQLQMDGARQYQRSVGEAIIGLFGDGQPLKIETFGDNEGKVIQYTSEINGD